MSTHATTPTSARGSASAWRSRLGAFVEAALTPHGLDRYLELVDPTWVRGEGRARIVAVEHTTPDSVTLRLRPNGRWAGFLAGQHTQLGVEIDGVRHTRCYSFAGSQHDTGPLELTVKAHPHGTVSRHLVQHAAVGDVVVLGRAAGAFVLPDPRPEEVLLVSGGSGITPVMAMLRTLCAEDHTGTITFLHYALTAEQMIYRDELELLASAHPNVRLVRVFTDEPGRGDLDGFLSGDQLDAACPGWRTTETYVCGPAPLMDAARALYDEAGCADLLRTEAFTLSQFVAEAGSIGGALRFDGSGIEVANDGRPILLQAEAAGLRPDHGCRMGICHTCTRSLVCGSVRHLMTGAVESDPGTPIQLCVNAPVGDVAIDL